jgi:hypothetical protein
LDGESWGPAKHTRQEQGATQLLSSFTPLLPRAWGRLFSCNALPIFSVSFDYPVIASLSVWDTHEA